MSLSVPIYLTSLISSHFSLHQIQWVFSDWQTKHPESGLPNILELLTTKKKEKKEHRQKEKRASDPDVARKTCG